METLQINIQNKFAYKNYFTIVTTATSKLGPDLQKVLCLITVWNLVVIAAERYLAVCQPFKHNNFRKVTIIKIYFIIYVITVILTSIFLFQVSEVFNLKTKSVPRCLFGSANGFLVQLLNSQIQSLYENLISPYAKSEDMPNA